jgi:hypothetical protein
VDEPGEKHSLSLEEALAAERRADLAREQACVPAALPLAIGEGSVPSATGAKGRPASHPERAALSTFWAIGQLCRIALVLAPADMPAEGRKPILESLPPELGEGFRHIIGRHRRYGRRRLLTRDEVKEVVDGIAELRDLLKRKPDRHAWTAEEMSKFDQVIALHTASLGPSIARKFDSDELATQDIAVLEGSTTPGYVRGLWKRLDEWGAARQGVPLTTFRSWRTKLRKDGLLPTPPPHGQAKRVRDN